ncbi:XdhC family protein [uncultured Microbacterium sp.]|uniref:XdhC family protein n=1 Tax=uncultured Microbacterium sp. TaxID=191216 RepID=UPI0025E8005D|nr:XdhC/CoxI family protein [uncultured Microbacterium sp.]
MLDRIADYAECFAEPGRWAIATIVEVSGSVPRPAGTSMAVRDDGRTIGSVSGGCVEGVVVGAALSCLDSGDVELHSFGYGDDEGLGVGLLCGGDVRVLVQPLRTIGSAAPAAHTHLVRDLPLHDTTSGALLTAEGIGIPLDETALCVAFDGDEPPAAVRAAAAHAADRVGAALRAGGAHVVEIADRSVPGCPVVRRLFVESTIAPPRLIVYGANDFSAALAQAAAVLGRRVTVCDARPVFATRERHPGADEVVLMHPAEHLAEELAAGRIGARTAVVVLTHDPRFDLPVLDLLLRREVAYVGAMGSRVTHEKRIQELRAGGLTDHELSRLHSPIGLDLGARTPAEVAVSILAELILTESSARAGSTAPATAARPVPSRLRDTTGDVHDDARRRAAGTARTEPARTDLLPAAPAATAATVPTRRACAASPSTRETPAWT